MVYVKVPHIKWAKSRDGKTKLYYHRTTNEKLGSGPVAEGMPAKVKQKAMNINARLAEKRERKEAGIGSIADLITLYRSSTAYKQLAEGTRADYSPHLDYLQQNFGEDPASGMDREFVLALKDNFSATPRKADKMAAIVSVISAFAIDRPKRFGLLVNPARRTGRMAKSSGFKPWPQPLIDNFTKGDEDLWRVVQFILNSGQRVSDAIKARWDDVGQGGIHVVQKKTGVQLWVPFTPAFQVALDSYPRRGEFVLAPSYSSRWQRGTLTHVIQAAVKAYGFDGYSLHGLRYNAAQNLAAAGCSPHEIASITGHRTIAMVQKYTAHGDQKRLAQAAVKKLTADR